MPTVLETAEIRTPIGRVILVAHQQRLCGVGFGDEPEWVRHQVEKRFGAACWTAGADPAGAVTALGRYFAGDLQALASVPVDTGGTPFQRRVWAALRDIPAGETRSYSYLARSIGAPKAVRAVGAANGANPVGIVIPCHRVIGANGGLVGYGGGLDRKRWLLLHEGVRLPAEPPRQKPFAFAD
ncbi:MAG: methylated-DNA--[protein]-cysteine S-methyltransferase [Vicinamibacteria bacterium]